MQLGSLSRNFSTTSPDVIVQDQKLSGTDGGTFEAGAWRARDLNTLMRNNCVMSLAHNQIMLLAGTYRAKWSAPAFDVTTHQSRLFNVTDSLVIAYGTNASASSGGGDRTIGSAEFTITASQLIELQHRCNATRIGNGFGGAANFGNVEVYSEMIIWKKWDR
jgi:hypothetical protein